MCFETLYLYNCCCTIIIVACFMVSCSAVYPVSIIGIKGTGEEKDMVLITGMASGTQML